MFIDDTLVSAFTDRQYVVTLHHLLSSYYPPTAALFSVLECENIFKTRLHVQNVRLHSEPSVSVGI